MEKVEETLWDVYKLVAAAGLPGFEAGYAVVAATREKWGSGADCVALFAPPVGETRVRSSAALFEQWRAAWSALLHSRSARPTRVPRRISVTLLVEAPLASQPEWSIRAIRVAPVIGSGWIPFGADGWPARGGLPEPALLGPRFEAALAYAAQVHGGHLRKGTRTPYLAHLLAVAALVLEDGGCEDEAIAALLHDAPEDRGGLERLADIRGRFGDAVAEIVAGCSDTFETPKPPWRERKERHLEALRDAPEPVLRVSLADKLHDARALLADFGEAGDALFERFNAGKEDQRWYYGELARVFCERLPCNRMASELRAVVERLREAWA